MPPKLHGQRRGRNPREDRVELLDAALQEKVARPAVALRADAEEAGLSRAEVLGADAGDGQAVRDAGESPRESRGSLRHRRDLQGELGEEAEVRAVSGHRDDLVEVASPAS